MKFSELEKQVIDELEQEKAELATRQIKSRLKEVQQARLTLARLESQYQAMLDKDVDSVLNEGQ